MSQIPEELLVKFLLGEATEAEQALAKEWINRNDENKRHYEHLKLIWDSSKKLASKSTIDENAAWERFKQRTDTATNRKSKTISFSPFKTTWARAAAILLIICSGILVYNMLNHSPEMLMASSGETTLIKILPDGSTVTLNRNSSISYPETFTGNERTISLDGEAFFNVTPDKSKPFVIHTNDVSVQVVGTSFNVKSTDKKTEVIVETGVVEVSKNDNSVRVNPNEKAYVLSDANTPVKEVNNDELYNYYRTHELVCNGTPLWRLVEVLNDIYDANITIQGEKTRNLRITTTFSNENLDTILSVIAETLNVRIEKSENSILIK